MHRSRLNDLASGSASHVGPGLLCVTRVSAAVARPHSGAICTTWPSVHRRRSTCTISAPTVPYVITAQLDTGPRVVDATPASVSIVDGIAIVDDTRVIGPAEAATVSVDRLDGRHSMVHASAGELRVTLDHNNLIDRWDEFADRHLARSDGMLTLWTASTSLLDATAAVLLTGEGPTMAKRGFTTPPPPQSSESPALPSTTASARVTSASSGSRSSRMAWGLAQRPAEFPPRSPSRHSRLEPSSKQPSPSPFMTGRRTRSTAGLYPRRIRVCTGSND
jgi:hypothetical protein